jgi:hypothetical protein
MLHDVPDDRLIAHKNHGFWFELGFFFESSTVATAKDNDFHDW